MSEREQLSKQHSEWLVKRQKAENRLKELEPKAVNVSHGEETEPYSWTPEKQEKTDEIRREVEEATTKILEIEEKLRKLPRKGNR